MARAPQRVLVILAAGQGTRMKSDIPKVLHKVCGWTLLHRVLSAAMAFAPDRIVVVAGNGKQLVRAELQELQSLPAFQGSNIEVQIQEQQLGTGHAAQIGIQGVDDDAVVMILPGDTPLLKSQTVAAIAEAFNHNSPELLVVSTAFPNPTGFGRIVRKPDGSVDKIVEEKDCTDEQKLVKEANSSIYVGKSKFLHQALASLRPENAQKELYLTDCVQYATTHGARAEAYCYPHHHDLLGANSRAELSVLEQHRRRELAHTFMDAGVTFEDPSVVYLDEDTQIGRESYIGVGVRLTKGTILGERVVVEAYSTVQASRIGNDSIVRFSSLIDDCEVGSTCEVGPYAHLRLHANLSDQVQIGNFVEVKKSKLGKGTKAKHLAYIGDGLVGEKVNIGAGTIFVNYDGKNKHQTNVEDGVFIGSNSTVVAPITLSAGAFIAAGSTVTKNVPGDALAIGRARQSVIEQWAAKRRSKSEVK